MKCNVVKWSILCGVLYYLPKMEKDNFFLHKQVLRQNYFTQKKCVNCDKSELVTKQRKYIWQQVKLTKSVFKIIGKSHYQGQKRTQRLRCAILWQNVTWFFQWFWISRMSIKNVSNATFQKCFAFQMNVLEKLENVNFS